MGSQDNSLERKFIDNIEAPANVDIPGLSRKLEEVAGLRFKSPIKSAVFRNLQFNEDHMSEINEHGASGEYNYETRKVLIDNTRIPKRHTVERIFKHEALHILEIDEFEKPPVRSHLTHAVLLGEHIDVDYRTELLKMSQVQKYLFGKDGIKIDPSDFSNAEKWKEIILAIEGAIITKAKNIKDYSTGHDEIMALRMLDWELSDMKNAYLAKLFKPNPKAVIEYERQMFSMIPVFNIDSLWEIYSFEQEITLAEKVLSS